MSQQDLFRRGFTGRCARLDGWQGQRAAEAAVVFGNKGSELRFQSLRFSNSSVGELPPRVARGALDHVDVIHGYHNVGICEDHTR